MALCSNCSDRNPAEITYSKAVPLTSVNCSSCGTSFFIPGSSGENGKSTEIVAGDQISVSDISDSAVDRFIVAFNPHQPLTVSFLLTAWAVGEYPAGTPESGLILFGKQIEVVELVWTYNKPNDIASQTLINNGGLAAPSLGPLAASYDYLGQNITADVQFTISGDDGQGKGADSIGSQSKSVSFGNYRVTGKGARLDSGSVNLATLTSFIEGLIAGSGTPVIATSRKTTLTAEGTVLEHHFYAFPKRFGFATFLENNVPGGYKRLGYIGGVIQVAPFSSYDAGESDIQISNGVSSEAYHIYQSAGDNIDGAIFEVE